MTLRLTTSIVSLFAVVLSALPFLCLGAGDEYKKMLPMVTVTLDTIGEAIPVITDGLRGIGKEASFKSTEMLIADLMMLPTLECADHEKTAKLFLLSQDPPDTVPDVAVVMPLSNGGSKKMLAAFGERFKSIEGKGIKVLSDPVDIGLISPIFAVFVDGYALVSTSVDGIRWLAVNLRDNRMPKVNKLRDASVCMNINGPMLGLLLQLVSTLDMNRKSEEATIGNTSLHLREIGEFLSMFSSVDVGCKASVMDWSLSFNMNFAMNSDIDTGVRALPVPDDSWMSLFPLFVDNSSVSAMPGLVSLLPASNRRWLASLSENTRLVGFRIMPACPLLDEKLYSVVTGTGASMMVADKLNQHLGVVSISALKNVQLASHMLSSYFSTNGAMNVNSRIRFHGTRTFDDTIVYEYDVIPQRNESAGTGISHTGDALAFVLNMNRVELAVAGDKLIVTRGHPGLIDQWLKPGEFISGNEKIASLTSRFPPVGKDESELGGGHLNPISIARKLMDFIPGMDSLAPRLPLAGNGFSWRLVRSPTSILFDVMFANNELNSCIALSQINSAAMQEFISQFVFNHLQRTADEESRQRMLKEEMQKMRERNLRKQ